MGKDYDVAPDRFYITRWHRFFQVNTVVVQVQPR